MVTCFDIVSMAVDEATKKYASLYQLNHTDYGYLKTYCEVIDNLADEFEAESFDAFVNETDMTIEVAIVCDEVTVLRSNHPFNVLTEHANSIRFAATKDGNMRVEFVFPSLWRKI